MAAPPLTVGVLGGMGPDATVDFMAKVIAMTGGDRDQDHVHLLVDHNPQVPNRQDAILHGGEDPGPVLATMAAGLEARGAAFLVIPCNTAYVFADDILAATSIPLVSIIDASIAEALRRVPAAQRIGILATDGCLKSGIFQSGIDAAGLAAVLPTDDEASAAMMLIHSIKAGTRNASTRDALAKLAAELVSRGAEAIIAGCTEIPLVLDDDVLAVPLISSTDALARRTVELATGREPLPRR